MTLLASGSGPVGRGKPSGDDGVAQRLTFQEACKVGVQPMVLPSSAQLPQQRFPQALPQPEVRPQPSVQADAWEALNRWARSVLSTAPRGEESERGGLVEGASVLSPEEALWAASSSSVRRGQRPRASRLLHLRDEDGDCEDRVVEEAPEAEDLYAASAACAACSASCGLRRGGCGGTLLPAMDARHVEHLAAATLPSLKKEDLDLDPSLRRATAGTKSRETCDEDDEEEDDDAPEPPPPTSQLMAAARGQR